ncbi:MAG: M13 family metallopeptidase, partial [Coriobacteriales bacterium]|nr:M13 family metallopeptidase [Coriobacteriales bacterium]
SLTKQGLEPIKPYTDAIMATKSLDELKDLLVSKDFPFSPWITLGISFADKRETNLVAITPNMLFADVNLSGGDPYQDSDDPVEQQSAQQTLLRGELYASLEAALLVKQGASDTKEITSEELQQMVLTMVDFEKSYGKKLDSTSSASKSAYGSLSAETACTMEELEKAFPNFPIKKLMARYGKDKGDKVLVSDFKWVEPFNALWVDENFETLKLMTAVKVFNECRTLLDQELFREVYESLGEVLTPEVVAYNACNQLTTFADVVAQNYVENTLGKDLVDRMTKASENLIATYNDLINKTSWFEDATRTKVLEKLDNMTLNVLYPDGGYYDYSGLKLKTSEEGGTLVSNYLAIKEYRNEQENARIGKPAYANVAWTNIAPTEINCFYNPSDNSINIFPGYISTANYSKDMKDEAFWAYIATVIGHEISHGFDYLGSQYDAYGRVEPLFAGDDADNFVERRNKLADYYSTITYDAEGSKVDGVGKCTEAAADLSGLQVVLEYVKSIDGFDYKTFFETYADMWSATFPPALSSMVITDNHPFAYLRANVNAQMFDEFYETFGVKEGDGMYLAPEKRIVIWGESA